MRCAACFVQSQSANAWQTDAGTYLALGLDGNLDDGVGEVHALKNDGALLIAQRLTCFWTEQDIINTRHTRWEASCGEFENEY